MRHSKRKWYCYLNHIVFMADSSGLGHLICTQPSQLGTIPTHQIHTMVYLLKSLLQWIPYKLLCSLLCYMTVHYIRSCNRSMKQCTMAIHSGKDNINGIVLQAWTVIKYISLAWCQQLCAIRIGTTISYMYSSTHHSCGHLVPSVHTCIV